MSSFVSFFQVHVCSLQNKKERETFLLSSIIKLFFSSEKPCPAFLPGFYFHFMFLFAQKTDSVPPAPNMEIVKLCKIKAVHIDNFTT